MVKVYIRNRYVGTAAAVHLKRRYPFKPSPENGYRKPKKEDGVLEVELEKFSGFDREDPGSLLSDTDFPLSVRFKTKKGEAVRGTFSRCRWLESNITVGKTTLRASALEFSDWKVDYAD